MTTRIDTEPWMGDGGDDDRDWFMDFDLRHVIESDPLRWPLLTLANAKPRVAYSTKIEWILPPKKIVRITECNLGHKHPVPAYTTSTEFNYTQIFRSRVFHRKSDAKVKLEDLCDYIESSLRDGRRNFNPGPSPHSTLGSIPSLLGRWPRKTDDVSLSILRPLVMMQHRNFDAENPEFYYDYEWIFETSVIAVERDSRGR